MEEENQEVKQSGGNDDYLLWSAWSEGLVMLFSAIIVGYSAYYYMALGPIMASMTFGAATVSSLVASVLLFVAGAVTEGSIFGQARTIEGVGEFIVIMLIITVMASGISLLVYRENFENVRNKNIQGTLDDTVLTYTLAVFHECCSLENELPRKCGETAIFPCYEDEAKFNKFMGIAPCGLLRQRGQVSATKPEKCGNQELIPFVQQFMDFLLTETTRFAATLTAFGVIMLFVGTCAGYCIYKTWKDDDNAEYTGNEDMVQRLGLIGDAEELQAKKDKDISKRERRREKKRAKRAAKKKASYDDYDPNPHNLEKITDEMENVEKEEAESAGDATEPEADDDGPTEVIF